MDIEYVGVTELSVPFSELAVGAVYRDNDTRQACMKILLCKDTVVGIFLTGPNAGETATTLIDDPVAPLKASLRIETIT